MIRAVWNHFHSFLGCWSKPSCSSKQLGQLSMTASVDRLLPDHLGILYEKELRNSLLYIVKSELSFCYQQLKIYVWWH